MSGKFFINYNTGAGNDIVYGDLFDAMEKADDGAAYTQESIVITDENGNEVARRQWYGCETGIEDEDDPIGFGGFGYYGDWQY